MFIIDVTDKPEQCLTDGVWWRPGTSAVIAELDRHGVEHIKLTEAQMFAQFIKAQ